MYSSSKPEKAGQCIVAFRHIKVIIQNVLYSFRNKTTVKVDFLNYSIQMLHTRLNRRKDTRRQKSKQSFQTKIMKSRIHCFVINEICIK